MVALPKLPAPMSVAEFLAWAPQDGRCWQLIDGEPVAMAPASRTHGTLQGELARQIGNHLRASGGPCALVVAPGVVPRLRSAHNVRVPDLAVTCTPCDAEEATLADPVLVIELLSPSNAAETWANVWAYATIPSLREILILGTVTIAADLLRRNADGTSPERPAHSEAGDLVLESIGLSVPLIDLYATTRLSQGAR